MDKIQPRENVVRRYFACGCRKVQSRVDSKPANDCGSHSKSYLLRADYWSVNPCGPWSSPRHGSPLIHELVPSSCNNCVADNRSHMNCHEKQKESNKRHEDGVDFYSVKFCKNSAGAFQTQSSRMNHHEYTNVPKTSVSLPSHSIVGHPSLKIYRFRLPHNLLPLLDYIVKGCHDHAKNLPNGWM